MHYFLLLAISLIGLKVQAQVSWESYLAKNTQDVSSNWKALDKAVKDKQYVLLGESSHGAKEFFEVKAELCKHLIEEHGFDLVLFESSMMATHLYNQHPKWRIDSISHAEHVLYPFFVNPSTIDLIDYLDDNKIAHTGFDVQLGSYFQAKHVTDFVYQAMKQLDTELAKEFLEIDRIHVQEFLVRFSQQHVWYKDIYNTRGSELECNYWMKRYQRFHDFFLNHQTELDSILGGKHESYLFENALLTNICSINDKLLNSLWYRDSLMYRNIHYILSEMYPGKKAIIWAHNAHIAKNYHLVDSETPEGDSTIMTFGHAFNKQYGDQALVLGLYGLEGATNNNIRREIEITAIEQDSTLEYLMNPYVKDRAILNLTSPSIKKANQATFLCHWSYSPEKMLPQEQFDLLLFLRHLSPSIYSDHERY